VSSYQQVYNNYVPALRIVIPELKKIRTELQMKIYK